MSLKIQALARTIGVIAAAGIASFLTPMLLNLIPPAYYMIILVVILISIFAYILYGIILGQLEYQAKLKEISQKN